MRGFWGPSHPRSSKNQTATILGLKPNWFCPSCAEGLSRTSCLNYLAQQQKGNKKSQTASNNKAEQTENKMIHRAPTKTIAAKTKSNQLPIATKTRHTEKPQSHHNQLSSTRNHNSAKQVKLCCCCCCNNRTTTT